MIKKNLTLTIGPSKTFLARQLREHGLSLRDISKELNVPVTSLKRLIGGVKLTEEQKKRLSFKRKTKIIKLDYKDDTMTIKGSIKIRCTKKRLFNEKDLIGSFIEIIRTQL